MVDYPFVAPVPTSNGEQRYDNLLGSEKPLACLLIPVRVLMSQDRASSGYALWTTIKQIRWDAPVRSAKDSTSFAWCGKPSKLTVKRLWIALSSNRTSTITAVPCGLTHPRVIPTALYPHSHRSGDVYVLR